jgi:cyclic dehypoxanthinyl futalosine synthase
MLTHSNSLAQHVNIDAVIAGDARLDAEQAVRLFHEAPLHDLGRWASDVCRRIHGDRVRTYVIDRNINYTNICSANCTFCAFKRDDGDEDAYTLDTEQLRLKVRELVEIGGTQVLLQGGMNPSLPIEFYEDMLRALKSEFPAVHIHGFSPPEFVEFVAVFKVDGFPTTAPNRSHTLADDVWHAKLEAIIRRLMAAGLDSIPGGGGEIFAQHVRRRIGLGKATAQQWLDVMACAHRMGMFTSATMMFGHIESVADRIDHMLRVRDAQDRAIEQNLPGKYVSFISWPFQRENTPLGRLPEWDCESAEPFAGDVPDHPRAGKELRMAGATDYLRTQALSRLVLDNVASIGSSWVTMGPKIGQLGLFFGANDMGSVMMEENVVSAAGTTWCLNESVLCHLVRAAGFTPAQRDNQYNLLKVHDDGDAPDRQVTDWSRHRVARLHVESRSAGPGDEGAAVPLTIAADAQTP